MSLSADELLAQLPKALTQNRSQALLTAVLRAERAHQGSVTRSLGERPAELDRALVARVRFNLETTDVDDVADVTRVGWGSEDVRELEAPFRRGTTAEAKAAAEAAAAPARRPAKKAARKRTAKKATAKKAAATRTAPANPAGAQQAASPASSEGN